MTDAADPGWPGRDQGVTERESEVLVLLGQGRTNREIADELYLGVETVKTHLRNVYAKLGLRNRAHAAAYVHGLAADVVPLDWEYPQPGDAEDTHASSRPADVGSMATRLALTPETVAERLAVVGLDAAARSRLTRLRTAVQQSAPAWAARWTDQLASHPETAWLIADEARVDALRRAQVAYLDTLFAARFDDAHVERALRVGAVHHRARLPPHLFVASYAWLLTSHLDVVWAGAVDDADAVATVGVLFAAAMFDAGLSLDAYEMAVEDEMTRPAEPSDHERRNPPTAPPAAGSGPGPADRTRRSIERVELSVGEADERRRFVQLDDRGLAHLRAAAPPVLEALGAVVAAFYERLHDAPTFDRVLPADTSRLAAGVEAYWAQMLSGACDMAQAARSAHVGMVHERLGVMSSQYLAGLAAQVQGMLDAVAGAGGDVRATVAAYLRAVCFDASFVVHAYLDARAAKLLETGRYADALLTRMANGVAIVDQDDRIEHANAELVKLAGAHAGVLRRMPLEAALPIRGLADLVAAARRSDTGRANATGTWRGAPLMLSAIDLAAGSSRRPPLVALVVTDISALTRTTDAMRREVDGLARVLHAIDAVTWEMSGDAEVLVMMAGATDELLGVPIFAALSRRHVADFVDDRDRDRFLALCQGLAPGSRQHLDHLVVRPDGSTRAVRTTCVAERGDEGTRVLRGVTIAFDED